MGCWAWGANAYNPRGMGGRQLRKPLYQNLKRQRGLRSTCLPSDSSGSIKDGGGGVEEEQEEEEEDDNDEYNS